MTGGELLNQLVDLIGYSQTVKLLAARGGEEVYIPGPTSLSPDHWLAQAVGMECALKLAVAFQGEKLCLPLGPEGGSRNNLQEMVLNLVAAGFSTNQIVRETGLHYRTVTRIKNRGLRRPARPTADPRQMRLFDAD